ncbi:hypothetical protein QMK19_18055 [Streptomyces sp. H10-C2]|uniref:hypothetical protein n=1 Tax=unclassified Streptomyces TaxID=2593676 RepID=UPI0024BB2FB1|nr:MULTISPECIES: hypothetical protein [unclassified Streptomyces]MDJ0343456.1 hypothetical protein [Streptomyces sp. PH10-H1]MDJ0371536.1 hypothetical protein [Streptomyces sp. H10-C2]
MTVRYIRVNTIVDLFAPAVRAFGNIAVVGRVTPPAPPPSDLAVVNVPLAFSDPAEARRRAPGELGEAIALAFAQSPGPTLIHGIRVDSATPDWGAGLDTVAGLNVQLVMLANTPLTTTTGATNGPVAKLVNHVASVSTTGGDGMERMGVAMLAKGSADPALVTGGLANERMVYIAHQSDQDAAAAVAGTIAGYQPHVSLLLKPVNITSPSFTPTQIDALNGSETFGSGPAGLGVNWLTTPSLIPGQGVYMGEGYTAGSGPGQKKFIDSVRAIDNASFLLKAQLIKTIGNVRISRSGLRALIAQMEAVLGPLVQAEVLEGFELVVPLLTLLDKDPATLSAAEAAQIHNAHAQRRVQVLAALEYTGGISRIDITLKIQ